MKKRLIAMFCALILLISALPAASALEGEGPGPPIFWRH